HQAEQRSRRAHLRQREALPVADAVRQRPLLGVRSYPRRAPRRSSGRHQIRMLGWGMADRPDLLSRRQAMGLLAGVGAAVIDAGGVYSGFSQASAGGPGGGPGGGQSKTDDQTFLRGTQVTDANGLAEFQTIYPGWYRGRAVHIHMKVHVGGSVVHTGQLFFDDNLTDQVYQPAPYNTRGSRDVRNADDSIFRDAGAAPAVVATTPRDPGH